MKIPTMIKNVGSTNERIVVRGELLDGTILFYNYLDDDDCVVENMRPDIRLVVEIEKK